MPNRLHIDIETRSAVDIKKSGAYAYADCPLFEIMLVGYAFDDDPVRVVDLTAGEELPESVVKAIRGEGEHSDVQLHAHNAAFERVCFSRHPATANADGSYLSPDRWRCNAVQAAYCGLPMSLKNLSAALEMDEDSGGKSDGLALIRFFCVPRRATKKDSSAWNTPADHPEKWAKFVEYCAQDVVAERETAKLLKTKGEPVPDSEWALYALDQRINDNGILADRVLAENAIKTDTKTAAELKARAKDITGLSNPNSRDQLLDWLTTEHNIELDTLTKASVGETLDLALPAEVRELLELRQKMAKTSVKKYQKVLDCLCADGRLRGMFQFYGAQTGRWAGRLVQLQNLPRNYLKQLDRDREAIRSADTANRQEWAMLKATYPDLPDTLSQLIRTVIVAPEGKAFVVSDYSAIEARVLSWLADEEWRLEVFRGDGKIYEASAAAMFGVPVESVTKGSDLRAKGKVAELACGYQGGHNALKAMGGEAMGLSESDMRHIVAKWRDANRNIVRMWYAVQDAAEAAVKNHKRVFKAGMCSFRHNGTALTITLPSGRKLVYWNARITQGRFGEQVSYAGMEPYSNKWGWVHTYGGKLVENITQAVARDMLAYSLEVLDRVGYRIVGHVHDEAILEVNANAAAAHLAQVEWLMGMPPDWADDFPLGAEGFYSPYYKKD